MQRHTYCEIDLSAIRNNVRAAGSRLADGVRLLAVVKADAYGHGAAQTARAALEAGADMLAVAIAEEGVDLRLAGIEAPILVLGGMEESAAPVVAASRLTQAVFDEARVRALSMAGVKLNTCVQVHMKMDTGMGRIGVRSAQQAQELAALIDELPGVELTGCFTHLAVADEDERETAAQLERFERMAQAVKAVHPGRLICHAANTAAMMNIPAAQYDMVRAGIAIYGCPAEGRAPGFVPAMRWISRAVQVKTIAPGERVSYGGLFTAQRETAVMTVPVGYADGYRRSLTGKASVLVRGRRAKVIGRICMDQIMVDVTDIPGVQAGDEVVLLGKQGEEEISVWEMAQWMDTITYEAICAPSSRVPRVYKP